MKKIIIYEFQDLRYASRARKEAVSLSKEFSIILVGFNSTIRKKSLVKENNLTIIEFPLIFGRKKSFLIKALNIFYLNLTIGYYIIKTKVDIYFMHNLKLFYPSIISVYINNAKLVYDAHELHIAKRPNNTIPQKFLTWYDKCKELYLIKKSDLIIQASDERAEFFSRYYRTSKPLVINNYANYAHITGNTRNNIREDCQLNEDEKLIIFTGNISIGGNQRIDCVIESLKYLEDKIHLALLGQGSYEAIHRLSAIAKDINVFNRIHFLSPVLSEQVVSYISGADLSVIPIFGIALNSRFSALNKVSQSLMAGIPIVSSNYFNLKKLILDNHVGRIGELFNVENPKSIANAINVCLKSPDYHLYKINSYRLAKEHINWENQEKELIKAMQNLI